MTMMNLMSHGTQDMYPTLLGIAGYTKTRIADVTVLSMIGAILGGLAFGTYSDRSGRRRSMITAASCALLVLPLWIAGFSPLMTLFGVFLMQFFVQGAWGVIPAHINELSLPACADSFLDSRISSASCAQRASPTSSPRLARSSRIASRWACS